MLDCSNWWTGPWHRYGNWEQVNEETIYVSNVWT